MEPISVLTLVGLSISLLLSILKEIFSARARARQRSEKFEISKKEFLELVEKILINERAVLAKESRQAKDIEDELERDSHELF